MSKELEEILEWLSDRAIDFAEDEPLAVLNIDLLRKKLQMWSERLCIEATERIQSKLEELLINGEDSWEDGLCEALDAVSGELESLKEVKEKL